MKKVVWARLVRAVAGSPYSLHCIRRQWDGGIDLGIVHRQGHTVCLLVSWTWLD